MPNDLPSLPVARKVWRTLEPYHGLAYFAPEATAEYTALGLESDGGVGIGYFAARAAPLGAVPAEVVIATFFNFHPDLVRRAIPAAWVIAPPPAWVLARRRSATVALRRLLGDAVGSAEMAEAAELARTAAAACPSFEGRPLAAAYAALAWPDEPHLVLWQAATVLREYRGDGHVALLTTEGLSGCQALVVHAATGEVPRSVLQSSRGWSDEEWEDAVTSLAERGLVTADGSFTDEGRARRQFVEERTDALAAAPYAAIGAEGCARLRDLARPWSRTIAESGAFGALRPSR